MALLSRAIPILLCLTISIAGLAASISAARQSDDSSIVAVFPPWWSASRALVAASDAGAIVNSGAFPFVLVVQSQRPGLGARLRAAGALLLLNPLGFSGCESTLPGNQDV